MVTMLGKLEEVKGAFCGDNPTTFLNIEDHPLDSIGQKFSHHLWTTVPLTKEFQDPRLSPVRRNRSFLGTGRGGWRQQRAMTALYARFPSESNNTPVRDHSRGAAIRENPRTNKASGALRPNSKRRLLLFSYR
ncbi:hypothetical protein HPB47_018340 [Ixodes persulcatus]|uniref:Uncharacterized protein n=1 Tax=Ixodes persulcatus TaxID=34615 RepID=A0AC60QL06_IXOPE|nr:hypothetical protein HPB47_018340 [Ixodes persulcatus]